MYGTCWHGVLLPPAETFTLVLQVIPHTTADIL